MQQPAPVSQLQPERRRPHSPTLLLAAGWVVPGLGHLLLRRPGRAALLFAAIVTMWLVGLGLHGKVYSISSGDPLDLLGALGDAGALGLYIVAHSFNLGAPLLTDTLSDYGTKFLVAAGLLNVMAAVDAERIANGRKPDYLPVEGRR